MKAAGPLAHTFTPGERPIIPGGPYLPVHPHWRKVAYLSVAIVAAVTATLGNALVNVNVATIAGSLGEYVSTVALLPALYVAMSASGNLSLIKARIRFGIPHITYGLLIAYACSAVAQLLAPGLPSAAAIRVISGISGTALTAVTMYYLLQVFPPKARPAALVLGIGLIQLATPLARLVPVELLAQNHWRGLTLIELSLPLTTLVMMLLFPLPPSDRSNPFEPLDFLTTATFACATILLCVVLSQGRLAWWTDAPWLGWALAAAVPLFAIAFIVEASRSNPLLHLEWIGSAGILRFAAVAILVRIALAEQSYGAVGLLNSSGLNNDQLRILFSIVLAAMILGIVTAIVTLRPERLRQQVIAATFIISFGAWLDSQATNQSGPEQLYLSQALIGFGTTLFIGPALAFGFLRMMARGPEFFVSLVVLFGATQNIGGLVGSALLGSYQAVATRSHILSLSENLPVSDPEVVARLQAGGQVLAGVVVDPLQRTGLASRLLSRQITQEATILAFNDVFRFVALLAFSTALFGLYFVLRDAWRARRPASQEIHA